MSHSALTCQCIVSLASSSMGQPQAECMVRARGIFFFDGNGNLKRGRGRATACGRSVAPFRQGEWDRDSDSDLFFLESTSIDQNSPLAVDRRPPMGFTETGPVTRSLRGHFAPRLAGYLKVSSPHGPVTGTVPTESCVFRVAGGPQAATAEVVSSLG